jgi:hypothetical protein
LRKLNRGLPRAAQLQSKNFAPAGDTGGTRSPSALANKIAERSNLSRFAAWEFGIVLGEADPPAENLRNRARFCTIALRITRIPGQKRLLNPLFRL